MDLKKRNRYEPFSFFFLDALFSSSTSDSDSDSDSEVVAETWEIFLVNLNTFFFAGPFLGLFLGVSFNGSCSSLSGS